MHTLPDWTDRITFKAALLGVEPLVWRRMVVPSLLMLPDLHRALQIAFGWTDSHLHAFRVADVRIGVPDPQEDLLWVNELAAPLGAIVRLGSSVTYEYDFGDGWEHELVVEKLESNPDDLSIICIGGARACPPEDCGGVGGYEDLLAALADRNHPEHRDLKRWVPKNFNPEACDLAKINRHLRPIGTHLAALRKREISRARRRLGLR